MFILLKLLSVLVTLYTIMCFARIVCNWVPSLQNTVFSRVLSSLCDPYLYFFKRFSFLRFQNLDFSPIVAIAILATTSSLLASIILRKTLSLGILLALLTGHIWSLVSSLLSFFIVSMLVRLFFLLIYKDTGAIWQNFDRLLHPITTKIAKIFFAQRYYSAQTALIVSIIVIILIKVIMRFAFSFVAAFFNNLPF